MYAYRGGDAPFTAHRLLLDMVGSGKRVLDVGCASGYLAERLKAQGCRVTGLERDASAAEQARAHCEQVLVGSADDEALLAKTGGGFDVILCGDVLEHLPDPTIPLRAFSKLLSPGGSLVVSLPNIAYLTVRLGLLFGRFEYRDEGILDRTHLRFFTRRSARRLFESTGWRETEFRPAWHRGRLSYALVRMWPSLLAPQFVFRLMLHHSSDLRNASHQ